MILYMNSLLKLHFGSIVHLYLKSWKDKDLFILDKKLSKKINLKGAQFKIKSIYLLCKKRLIRAI